MFSEYMALILDGRVKCSMPRKKNFVNELMEV